MPLNQSGVVDKVGLQNLSEILTQITPLSFESETDFDNNVDETGITHDTLSDHAGVGIAAGGYKLGSLTEALAGYYPLDGDAIDSTELGNDGTINGATFNGSGQVGNNSLSFDGTDDDVELPNIDTVSTLEFTWTCWIQTTDTGNNIAIYSEGSSAGTNPACLIAKDDTDVAQFYIRDDSAGTTAKLLGSTSVNDGNWYHIAGVMKPTEQFLYVDGTQEASGANDFTSSTFTIDQAAIGVQWRDTKSYFWDGLIDDVRIFDRTLSQPEIEGLANRTNTSPVTAGDTV